MSIDLFADEKAVGVDLFADEKLPKQELLEGLAGTSIADVASDVVGAPMAKLTGDLVGMSVGGYESAIKSLYGDTGKAITDGQQTQKTISDMFAPKSDLAKDSTDTVLGALSQLNKIPAGWGGIADLIETRDPEIAANTVKEIEKKGLPQYMGDKNFEAYGSPLLATLATVTPEIAAIFIPTASSLKRGKLEKATKELEIVDQIESGVPGKALAEYKLKNRDKWTQPTQAEIDVLSKKLNVDKEFARNMAEAMPVLSKKKSASKAVNQEWDKGLLGLVQASSKADIDVMSKMLATVKQSKDNILIKAQTRPIYEAGTAIENIVKFALDEKNTAGRRVGAAAEALRGVQVDYAPAVDKFIGSLVDDGVVINGGNPITDVRQYRNIDFRNSPYDGSKASEDIIRKQISRMTEKDFAMDGFNIHTTKKNLPSFISTAKKSEGGLVSKAEILLTTLRRDLNDVLRNSSDEYMSANDDFIKAITPLNELNDAMPKTAQVEWDGINANNAGKHLRIILSNYADADNLYKAVSNLDEFAIGKGKQFDADAVKQAFFAIGLDKRLGAFAETSLQGVTESSAHRASSFIPTSSLDLAGKIITGARRKVMAVDDNNAIKAMEDYLKEARQGK